MHRLLVIRGGAIGDFVLTLPALGALRQAAPRAHIEVLGLPHRASLARHPAYADRITDLEDYDLFRLFSRQANVSERLAAYLRNFEAVFAYLPDPGGVLDERLRQHCQGYLVVWPPQPGEARHVTDHLLQPVQAFRAGTYDPVPGLPLSPAAVEAAERFWHTAGLPEHGVMGLHPGSGGARKLWPMAGWQHIMQWAAGEGIPCIVFSGPAEHAQVTRLFRETVLPPWPCAGEMPLMQLAALMARCQVFMGHDSGLTHLAAAVGTPTLALFGPTDPLTWGPRHHASCVLQPRLAGPLSLHNLPPQVVQDTLEALWRGSFVFTPSGIGCTIRKIG